MGIWLKDAMKIEPFNRAELVAGKKGIERMVVSANIQEVPDVDKWLYGGEILFTSGYAFESVEHACELIDKLDSKGVAAMVLKLGWYYEDVPVQMIEKADELGFPLFRMPADLPYMDCIFPILISISNMHQVELERTERIHNQLLVEMVSNRGLSGICSVLHQVTGKPVHIFSNHGLELASDGCSACPEEESNLETLFQQYLKKYYKHYLIQNKCNLAELADRKQRVIIPVCARKETLAYLVFDCDRDAIRHSDLLAFENASTMIAIELIQQKALLEKEQNVHARLLEDILQKKYRDPDILNQRLAYVGFPVKSPCIVCEIGADDFESYLKQNMSKASEEEIQKLRTDIKRTITNAFFYMEPRILCMEDGVENAALMSVKNDASLDAYIRLVERILSELKESYPGIRFSAGFGQVTDSVLKARSSWDEAKLAKKAGQTLNTQRIPITKFEDLGAIRFLYESAHSVELRKFYHEYMGALFEYDNKNGTELVDTLTAYFANSQNIRKTADQLYVHKNSVIYRLNKIEEIIGKSLDDPETAFNIQMCLHMRMFL